MSDPSVMYTTSNPPPPPGLKFLSAVSKVHVFTYHCLQNTEPSRTTHECFIATLEDGIVMFFIRTLDQFACLRCLQRWRLKSQMQSSTISWTDRRAGKNKHTSSHHLSI